MTNEEIFLDIAINNGLNGQILTLLSDSQKELIYEMMEEAASEKLLKYTLVH